MLLEHKDEHHSEWAAMQAIASKLGCTGETLRKWVKEAGQTIQPQKTAQNLHPASRKNPIPCAILRVMKKRYWLALILIMIGTGYLLPEQRLIPVQNASPRDWNPKSFWYYPWGRSGTHKGIDIFAKRHTPVQAATTGLVLFSGHNSMGGNVLLMLGSKWRLHYYAHLQTNEVQQFSWVKAGERIGSVGDSGNAAGKQPHLHYTIRRLIPNPLKIDVNAPQGWQKMFFVDPGAFLTQ